MSSASNAEKRSIDSEIVEYAIVPPDGGWGWVVVLSALYCNTVVDGILFTFGMYMQEMVKAYNTDQSYIALIGSLMYGVHLAAGPLCAAFTKAYGIRPLVAFGSILVSASLASAYFNPPLWLLTILFGFCAGIGLCFVYMLSITITAIYFTRARIFAVGIVVCGTGLGTLIFAQASSYMMKTMDWKESHLVLSGCSLLMAVAGLAFKPLQPRRINTTTTVPADEIQSTFSLTSQWDEEGEDKTVVILTKSRANSITSVFDATHLALEVFTEGLVEEKNFFTDHLVGFCGRIFPCFRPRTQVLLMHPKKRRDIMTKDVEKMKWTKKEIVTGNVGRGRRIINSFKNIKWSLLKEIKFLLFCVSTSFSATAIIIIFTFESERFLSADYTHDVATLMISILGASNMCWRLLLGFICLLFPKANYHALSVAGHCMAGVMTIASASTSNSIFNYAYCGIVGLGLGCNAVFRPVVLLELVGMENLSDATGIMLFFNGILAVFGPPIGGLISSMTGDVRLIFVLAGLLFLVSGIMLIFITERKSVIHIRRTEPIPSSSTTL